MLAQANNSLESKSTFNRITERDLNNILIKCMYEKKERIINEVDLQRKNTGYTYESYSRNTKKYASLSPKKWWTYRRKRKLAALIRNKNMLCFRIKYRNQNFMFLQLPSTR